MSIFTSVVVAGTLSDVATLVAVTTGYELTGWVCNMNNLGWCVLPGALFCVWIDSSFVCVFDINRLGK